MAFSRARALSITELMVALYVFYQSRGAVAFP